MWNLESRALSLSTFHFLSSSACFGLASSTRSFPPGSSIPSNPESVFNCSTLPMILHSIYVSKYFSNQIPNGSFKSSQISRVLLKQPSLPIGIEAFSWSAPWNSLLLLSFIALPQLCSYWNSEVLLHCVLDENWWRILNEMFQIPFFVY